MDKYLENCGAGYEKIKGAMLMFGDEAGFERISKPTNCWAPPKQRPSIPVREYVSIRRFMAQFALKQVMLFIRFLTAAIKKT